MPRGQKSKLRARERRRVARSEAPKDQHAQATLAEDDNPQSSPDAGSHSKESQGAISTTTSVSDPCIKSDEGAESRDEERPSTSQARSTTDPSDTDQIEELAISLVKFMLQKYKMRLPITRREMLRHILKENKERFPEILKKASEVMVLAFGIDVKEVDPTNHCYVLVSKLNLTRDTMLNGEPLMPKTGLLLTILCVIFVKGNCASEESVWEVLNVMGIYEGVNHFVYGDAKKLITQDLVRERYLEYRQVPDSDPPRYQFLWGPRAYLETSKMKVLEFLAKVHNTVPSAFPPWYEEALRDEEERAHTRIVAMLLARAMARAHSRGYFRGSFHPF